MFGYTTLKNIVGRDVALSEKMIDAINEWQSMLDGQAEWVNDSVESIGIEKGTCREFADIILVEMETAIDNKQLDKIYQKGITNLV